MNVLSLVLRSLAFRRTSVALTVLSLGLSVALFLGVARLSSSAKISFESTINGIDLIVGARTSSLQLLLHSVFHMGAATNLVSTESFHHWKHHPQVEWAIPVATGDSHRGFRVVGTTVDYFEFFRFGPRRSLSFVSGESFSDLFEVVLGSHVAHKLGYSVTQEITMAHGHSDHFLHHTDKPFRVVGILQPTGTRVDHSLFVSLESISALHVGWEHGAPPKKDHKTHHNHEVHPHKAREHNLAPPKLSAFFMKLKSPVAGLKIKREINEFETEPLSAIRPGQTLIELWNLVKWVEGILFVVSALVFLVSLLGTVLFLLSNFSQRLSEMSVLRAVGAPQTFIWGFNVTESVVVVSLGLGAGAIMFHLGIWWGQPWLDAHLGLHSGLFSPQPLELYYALAILLNGAVAGCGMAFYVYRQTFSRGLVTE